MAEAGTGGLGWKYACGATTFESATATAEARDREGSKTIEEIIAHATHGRKIMRES
jgi:hypothetical protein